MIILFDDYEKLQWTVISLFVYGQKIIQLYIVVLTKHSFSFSEHDKNKTTCPTLRPGVYQPFWNELSKKVFIDVGRWIVVGLAAFNIAREVGISCN